MLTPATIGDDDVIAHMSWVLMMSSFATASCHDMEFDGYSSCRHLLLDMDTDIWAQLCRPSWLRPLLQTC